MTPARVRNIGIIAHIDAGKTTTTERILFYTGRIHRMGNVDDGNTVTDWYSEEQRRGISIFSAAVTVEWKDYTINLIDTPGHVDFTAEVERSLRVLDGAIGVFCGVGGVEAQSETVWRQANRYRIPRLAYVNKLDRIAASYDRVLEAIRARLGAKVVPITIPLGQEADFEGVIDVIDRKALTFDEEDEGATVGEGPVPPDFEEAVRRARETVLDLASHYDDEVLGAVLDGREPTPEQLRRAIRAGTLKGELTPAFAGSSLRNKGVQPLLDGVCAFLPAPVEAPPVEGVEPDSGKPARRKAAAGEPACALAFKTATDTYGETTYVRLYSGCVRVGQTLYNPRANRAERIQKVWRLFADERQEMPAAEFGDIVAVGGLKHTVTGDTLCEKRAPILLEPPRFPDTVISMAIEPKASGDRDRLLEAIQKLVRDDPTFRSRIDPETGQIVISGMGELHLEILKHRITADFSVAANVGELRVAYREAPRRASRAEEHTTVRAGERTLSGHVVVEMRPSRAQLRPRVAVELPPELEAAMKRYLPAIRDGLLGGVETGAVAGYPVIYTEVALVGGSVPDDAAEAAFTTAAGRAVQRALEAAGPWVFEPHMRFEITTPPEYLGEVLGDLNRRRADIQDVETGKDVKVVRGAVALSRVLGYSTAIRSLTQGRAGYTLEPLEYRPLAEDEYRAMFGEAR